MTTAAMLRPDRRGNADLPALLILLLFSFFLLLIAGSDGWWREPTPLSDRAWFFMCGKAWMSGLTPYVDFADSKGPLLWLLYGIGYLISPRSLHGLFPFELAAYWLAFFLLYRAALAVMESRAKSLAAAMAMALFYFPPGIHDEILVEDYCQLFNAVAFYVMVRVFISGRIKVKYALWLGICCGCALMMKYVYFFTLGIPAFVLFVHILVRKTPRWGAFLLSFVGGVGLVVVPLCFYLWIAGAFRAMVEEYFLNTFGTIQELGGTLQGEGTPGFPRNVLTLYTTFHLTSAWVWASLLGLALSCLRFRRRPWMVAALICWYAGSLVPDAMVGLERYTYFLGLSVFFFGAVIWVVGKLPRFGVPTAIVSGACVLMAVTLTTTSVRYSEFYHAGRAARVARETRKAGEAIRDVESALGRPPALYYYRNSERGEGMLSGAVPAGRYWSVQAGMTPEMAAVHEADLIARRPDLVIVKGDDLEARREVEKAGYALVMTYMPIEGEELCLFKLITN